MKVKIRKQIFDSSVDSIEITLTEKEKESIKSMPDDTNKYCVHPNFMRRDEVIRFIKGEEEDDL